MSKAPSTPVRTRRWIGGLFIALGALWLIAMLVSIKWWFGYCSEKWLLDVGDGTIYYAAVEKDSWSSPLYGWTGGKNTDFRAPAGTTRDWKWTWWTWGKSTNPWDNNKAYSVWPASPLLLTAGSAMLFPGLHAARRRRRNQCPNCGYSREGLSTDSPCPECGTTAESVASIHHPPRA